MACAQWSTRWLRELGLALALEFAAGLLALCLFVELTEVVMSQESAQLDTAVLTWLQRFSSPTLDTLARAVSAMGSEGLAVILVLLLALLGWQRRWRAIIALLLATGGAQLLNDLVKTHFHRTRPAPVTTFLPGQAFSFPSGHAMVAAAFYLFLTYLGWRLLHGWQRTVCAVSVLLLVLLIGLARLYLGVHYLTDVFAGYLAGFLWTDSLIIGGSLLARKYPAATAAHPAPR